MRGTVYRFSLIAFFLCSPLLFCAEGVRTWQDSTGLFSVEATLQSIDGDSIQLRRTDGTVITLPLARLSEADQRYVAGVAAGNPFDPVENPFEPADVRPTVRAVNNEIIAVDISRTRDTGGVVSSGWSNEPDPKIVRDYPAATRLVFRSQRASASLPQSRTAFFIDPAGKITVLAFNYTDTAARQQATQARNAAQQNEARARIAAQQAEIRARIDSQRGIVTPPPNVAQPANTPPPAIDESGRSFTRVFLGDTVSGNTNYQDSPLKLVPFGFSPNGKRLLFHQEDWGFPPRGKQTLLHIAEIDALDWTITTTYEPFAQLKRANSTDGDVHWATWADDKHILVQSGNGTVMLMNVDTGEAIWRTRSESNADITLSPGGKYFFVRIGTRAVLHETMTGRPIGAVDRIGLRPIRFSPNGKRFATINAQGIILGNATTGTTEAPFYLPGISKENEQRFFQQENTIITTTPASARTPHFFWLDDRYILFGDNVVDTATKTVVWSYTGLSGNVKLAGGYSWCVFSRNQDVFLTPLRLPHAGMVPQDIPADPNVNLVLRPGAEVSVVIEDSLSENMEANDRNDREEVQKAIEKIITDNDWVLADAAPITIVLNIKEEEAGKVEYVGGQARPFGLPGPPMPPRPLSPISPFQRQDGIPIDYQPERLQLTIMYEGKELWSIDYLTRPPERLPLGVIQDASLQEVVDKAMADQSFPKWLEQVRIPRTISRQQEGKGTSRVTENGIEETRRRL